MNGASSVGSLPPYPPLPLIRDDLPRNDSPDSFAPSLFERQHGNGVHTPVGSTSKGQGKLGNDRSLAQSVKREAEDHSDDSSEKQIRKRLVCPRSRFPLFDEI